jgi:hypothetical protein
MVSPQATTRSFPNASLSKMDQSPAFQRRRQLQLHLILYATQIPVRILSLLATENRRFEYIQSFDRYPRITYLFDLPFSEAISASAVLAEPYVYSLTKALILLAVPMDWFPGRDTVENDSVTWATISGADFRDPVGAADVRGGESACSACLILDQLCARKESASKCIRVVSVAHVEALLVIDSAVSVCTRQTNPQFREQAQSATNRKSHQ